MSRFFTAFIGLFRRKPATLAERVSHVHGGAQKLTARTQAGLLGAHVGKAGNNIYTISKFRARK